MRSLFFLLSVLVLASCERQPVVITGQIDNPSSSEVEVFYYKNNISKETEKVIVELDEVNTFSVRMPIEGSEFVYLKIPGKAIKLYIKPKTNVYVEFDAQDKDQKPYISGNNSFESQFLVSYNFDIETKFDRNFVIDNSKDLTPVAFKDVVRTAKEEKLAYLENYEFYEELDEDFINHIRKEIDYQHYNYLLNYPTLNQYFNNLEKQPELPDSFYSFLDEDIIDDSAIEVEEYRNFLNNYLNYLLSQKGEERDIEESIYKYQFDIVKENFVGASRDFLLSNIVYTALALEDFEKSEKLYLEYKDVVDESPDKAAVTASYKKILSLMPGKPAPGFTLADIDGNAVSLSDFAGKVIYLDFWASWCGPCMREMPHAKELKERMKDQDDLVFMYVSIDTDENEWREAVEKNKIEGVHFNVSGRAQEVPASYNVIYIPTFYIIGRDGNIFDNNPPRPSGENIDEVLLEALGD